MIAEKYRELIERLSKGDKIASLSFRNDVVNRMIPPEEAALIRLHVCMNKLEKRVDKLDDNINSAKEVLNDVHGCIQRETVCEDREAPGGGSSTPMEC